MRPEGMCVPKECAYVPHPTEQMAPWATEPVLDDAHWTAQGAILCDHHAPHRSTLSWPHNYIGYFRIIFLLSFYYARAGMLGEHPISKIFVKTSFI